MNDTIWHKLKPTRITSPQSPLLDKYLMVLIRKRSPIGYVWLELEVQLFSLEKLPPTIGTLATMANVCIYRVSDGVAMMWDKDFFNVHCPLVNPLQGLADGN